MYGNIVPAGDTYHEVFKDGVPIPTEIINNKFYMDLIRSYHRYNVDIPGNVEDVNPMKFETNLTPIEELRFTPIHPISEKDIEDHKKKIEERRRRSEIFEVDKKKLYFIAYACIFGVIILQVIKYLSYEGEKINYHVEKLRLRRFRYREEDDFF